MKALYFSIICSITISLYGTSLGVPRKIWQTYRYKELPRPAKEARDSWTLQNPNYEYHFMDDSDIEDYILNNWDDETYAFFKALPLGVMKADLWRYLIIADKGGVYTDIDSICCLPIDSWLSFLGPLNKIENGKPMLFIGMENEIGFCQWTIMATPKHPAMQFACKYLVDCWRKRGIDMTSLNFVHLTTGPTIWKEAMLKYFGDALSTKTSVIWNKYNSDKSYRKKINNLGVYLLSDKFYNGFALVHLNGSTQFGEGYISWQKESQDLRRAK